MDREELLENISHEISMFYSKSSDFNGISFNNLIEIINISKTELKKILIELLKQNQITFTFSSVFLNPHIKAFKDLPIEKQLELLETESLEGVCIYPSPHFLERFIHLAHLEDSPYTKRLFFGEPQFEPVYFDMSVLERFFNDPRYQVHNDDYSGSIYVKDGYEETMTEKDEINLQTFGLAYNKDLERKIVVYLRYLNDLSSEQQQFWKGFEYSGICKQNIDYLRNTLGHWAENVSIFSAFIEELYHINEMSLIIGKPKLFRNDFKENRPKEFAIFLRPTLKNYNAFVHALDKMLSDNLNKDFFRGDIPLEDEIEREDGKIEIRNRGTIALLDEWITKNFIPKDPEPMKKIFKTLKKVRKERQKPAHSIQEDVFDKKYFTMQDDLIKDAYSAVRSIRLILANHPLIRGYEVPNWLYEGKVVLY
ncbi:MAG: hypothetical protein K0S34_16 [Bacillales bacterium]|jgi:hypothetical protein|nr:hypothetical protein [Bacillales bacterium]